MKTFSVIIGLLCGIASILCMSWTPLVICFCVIVVCALLQLSEGVAAIGRPTAAEQAKAEQAKAEQVSKHANDESLMRYFEYTGYEN